MRGLLWGLMSRVMAGGDEPLGRKGERYAARWLKSQGYRVLARNYRIGKDEADLVVVAPDGSTVVLVEVKTRTEPVPAPETGIDRKKQYRMARLASRLMREKGMADRPIRFDAIAIVWPRKGKPELRHYAGAFESPI